MLREDLNARCFMIFLTLFNDRFSGTLFSQRNLFTYNTINFGNTLIRFPWESLGIEGI
jgi:hypothetical protein